MVVFNKPHKKDTVERFWPMNNKRVLIRVDFNIPIRGGIISNDECIRDVLPVIKTVLERNGMVILISHIGRPKGISHDSIKHDNARLRKHLNTWTTEAGAGKTDFFATFLTNSEKMKVLEWSSKSLRVKDGLSQENKNDLFSELEEDEKTFLLDKITKEKRERNGEESFPFLRKYQSYGEELTLKPFVRRVEELLRSECDLPAAQVLFAPDCLHADTEVDLLRRGQVLVLENTRFYSDETSNRVFTRIDMAKKICSYGDYFVSDAFASSHRDSASMTGIPRTLGHGTVGTVMASEIDAFSKILSNTDRRPTVAIIGGAQLVDKILLLKRIMGEVDHIIIGGAIAYTFLKLKGFSIGKSFDKSGQSYVDQYGGETNSDEDVSDIDKMASSLLKLAAARNVRISLPVDHMCHKKCVNTKHIPLISDDPSIPDDYMGLDIGPMTIANFRCVIRECKMAIWNGTMGVCEIPAYEKGTLAIANILASTTEEQGLVSIIAGTDTVKTAELAIDLDRITHVTKGGAASLQLFEGMSLLGISVLNDANEEL